MDQCNCPFPIPFSYSIFFSHIFNSSDNTITTTNHQNQKNKNDVWLACVYRIRNMEGQNAALTSEHQGGTFWLIGFEVFMC